MRRDLRALAREGKLERVRGGAVNASDGARRSRRPSIERFEAKDRIGAAAARAGRRTARR